MKHASSDSNSGDADERDRAQNLTGVKWSTNPKLNLIITIAVVLIGMWLNRQMNSPEVERPVSQSAERPLATTTPATEREPDGPSPPSPRIEAPQSTDETGEVPAVPKTAASHGPLTVHRKSTADRPAKIEENKEKTSVADAPAGTNVLRRSAKVPNVTVKNQDGQVIFQGTVDLQPTLDRIDAGQRLSFSHDGIVFQNRERRLPNKPPGYYHEYVHPTPRQSGPGPQRIILGEEGEIYYTYDHYRSFKRIPTSK